MSIALYHPTNKLFTTEPTSITFHATLGGGSAKDPLDYPVYACFVDNEGNDIDDTEVTVTTKITDKDGSDFSVSMSTTKATDAYGVKIYHKKENSWNVRYFGFSLTYEAAASGSKASVPTFDPVSGTILSKAQNITIASTNAAKIIYTTNGDEPTVGGATTTTINSASGSIMIAGTGTITVKAKGIDDVNAETNLAIANYTIKPANPVILPASSIYTGTTDVSFTQADNIDVYYTTDGTTPTSASTKYNGTPFAITENLTITAIAIDTYGNASDVVTKKFSNTLIQKTDVTVSFNNVFLGVGEGTRIAEKTTVTEEGISFTFDKISGTNWPQGDADLIRMYKNTTLQIAAPAGYAITNITFTAKGDWKDGMTADVGVYSDTKDANNKTYWTGFADEVTFAPGGTHRISTVNVILAKTTNVAITAAGLATLTIDAPLDFTSVDGIEAYIAKENGSKIELEKVNKVPAGTGVLLRSVSGAAKAADVPVATTADDVTGNLFKRGTGAAVATDAGEGKTNYVLAKHGSDIGFYKANGIVVAANKAYLQTTVAAARIDVNFDETTALTLVNSEKRTVNSDIYNLAGQRVANPTKGLYIVNGRKVVVK